MQLDWVIDTRCSIVSFCSIDCIEHLATLNGPYGASESLYRRIELNRSVKSERIKSDVIEQNIIQYVGTKHPVYHTKPHRNRDTLKHKQKVTRPKTHKTRHTDTHIPIMVLGSISEDLNTGGYGNFSYIDGLEIKYLNVIIISGGQITPPIRIQNPIKLNTFKHKVYKNHWG